MHTSSDERVFSPLRLRADVEWSPMASLGDTTWVARDPVSLEYYHFSQLEKQIAQLLDGRRSLSTIARQFEPRGVTLNWLLELVTRLERASLIVPSEVGVAARRLLAQGRLRQRTQRRQLLLSPIAARFKLLDPTPLLEWLAPASHLLFSRLFFAGWLIAGVVTLYLVLIRWLQSPAELGLQSLTSSQLVVMAGLYVMIKSLHELGHALACRRWVAECHEVGVLFLLFMPCLYCDTSDSWKLPSRWRRAGIAAAGIYIELLLATLAGIVWLLAASGTPLQIIAGNIMLICSLSTVLVNGNPLLRYDGYYVLSDLWRVPNLHEQSMEALQGVLDEWFKGVPFPATRWDAKPYHLAAFGVAAWCYRQFVLVMICWLAWTMCANSGVHLLGVLWIGLILSGAIYLQGRGFIQWSRRMIYSRNSVRWTRVIGVIALLAGCGWFIVQVPMATFANSRAVAARAAMVPIYAGQTGRLVELTPSGQRVQAGETIVRVESPELEMDRIDTQGQLAVLQIRAEQLRGRLVDEEQLVAELATVVEEESEVRQRLAILNLQFEQLKFTAPTDGLVLPTETQPLPTLSELPGTQPPTSMLHAQQEQRLVERGTLLGWLSPSEQHLVTAYVDEATAERLQPDMAVRFRWDCQPGRMIRGSVVRIATEPLNQLPEVLMGDANISFQPGPDGRSVPTQTMYEVDIELFETLPETGSQSVGTAFFETAPQTLLETGWNWLEQQLRLP